MQNLQPAPAKPRITPGALQVLILPSSPAQFYQEISQAKL